MRGTRAPSTEPVPHDRRGGVKRAKGDGLMGQLAGGGFSLRSQGIVPIQRPPLPGTIFLVVVLIASGVPAVSATHWTLHDGAVDDTARRTLEPDDAVLRIPGNLLDGQVNRVVETGRDPGSGTLFLDARMGNRVGADGPGSGSDVLPPFATADTAGRSDLLLPGLLHVGAWYGWWRDTDTNGVIDDVHDRACDGSPCGGDEFTWKGLGSGTPVSIIHYVLPAPRVAIYGAGNATNLDGYANHGELLDRTNAGETEQAWVGERSTPSVDGGLLATVQTFTLAGAKRAIGTPLGYDPDDPAALVDVDRYEAVSPDLESLYASALRFGQAPDTGGATGFVFDAYNAVFPMVQPAYELAFTAAFEVLALGFQTAFSTPLSPWTPKEPNTAEDDHEGRALFGGSGDRVGSYNSYPAFQEAWHFWFEATAFTKACAGASATVPGTSTGVGYPASCTSMSFDPVAANSGSGARSAPVILGFMGDVHLWMDANGDQHVGDICDPSTDQFDAERNTCDPDHPSVTTYPRGTGDPEVLGACDTSTAKGGELVLTPIGGDWPGVIVVRNGEPARLPDEDPDPVPRTDAEPIILHWQSSCSGHDGRGVDSRDYVLFPMGAWTTPIRVESHAAIAGFKDAGRGIDVGAESVTDVDYLAASM